ncbi:hypothetical protein [Vibrio hippocampi]|uniref:Transposase n=1 Tax=Vibrio hippocampi TaxID=654686 RepID=A0ABN8DK81_9VIBR|nr:hypothetical protein [Vibrio hippocampi]CAH0529744.1 hypothetical protein VHP8226_03500 [Vibrio hippocampi]
MKRVLTMPQSHSKLGMSQHTIAHDETLLYLQDPYSDGKYFNGKCFDDQYVERL